MKRQIGTNVDAFACFDNPASWVGSGRVSKRDIASCDDNK